MLTVEADAGSVERRLSSGDLCCPGCGRVLAGWGHARSRVLRGLGGGLVRLRPRRARCGGCGVTHVLLPVVALCRRADLAEVIGVALAAKAGGAGFRPVAAMLGRAAETVRGWLRRFAGRAEAVRVFFTVLLVDTGPDPVAPAGGGGPVAVAVWAAASAASGGALLAPAWPGPVINTS